MIKVNTVMWFAASIIINMSQWVTLMSKKFTSYYKLFMLINFYHTEAGNLIILTMKLLAELQFQGWRFRVERLVITDNKYQKKERFCNLGWSFRVTNWVHGDCLQTCEIFIYEVNIRLFIRISGTKVSTWTYQIILGRKINSYIHLKDLNLLQSFCFQCLRVLLPSWSLPTWQEWKNPFLKCEHM
jgi:hypothetical protein